jgi:hypothetical protein
MKHASQTPGILTAILSLILGGVLIFTGCATTGTQPIGLPAPTGNLGTDLKAVAADVTGAQPASPLAAVTQSIDPLTRILNSPNFVEHAKASLVIAGGNDPIFSNCVNYLVMLGQDLAAHPLITLQAPALLSADQSCPLCLLAAKRKDLAQLQSGALAGQIAAVRARVRVIEQGSAIACAPLVQDETTTFARLGALFP